MVVSEPERVQNVGVGDGRGGEFQRKGATGVKLTMSYWTVRSEGEGGRRRAPGVGGEVSTLKAVMSSGERVVVA